MPNQEPPIEGTQPVAADASDVTAVLVARPDPQNPKAISADAQKALESLLNQSAPPGIVVVAHVGQGNPSPILVPAPDTLLIQTHVPLAKNFGQAIDQALAAGEVLAVPGVARSNWLWLIHDDMTADNQALGEMLAVGRPSGSVAVIGPKQLRADDPERLLELGIQAVVSGGRVEAVEADEIDQGQYDSREDVLGVGTAGMLVRRSSWDTLGGLDPALGPFGDGLEYGRRVRASGGRVVVAPKAKVFHKQLSHNVGRLGRGSFEGRRKAQLYNWALAVPPWSFPLLMLWLPILTLLRVGGRLVLRQPRLAAAELLAYLGLVAATGSLFSGRARLARVRKVPRRTVAEVESTRKDILQARRMRRKVAKQKLVEGPALDVLALNALRAHRIRAVGTLVAVVAVAAVISVFTWRLFGGGFQGGLWGNLPNTWSQLFAQATSGWQPVGVGIAGPADAALGAVAAVTALPALLGISPLNFGELLMHLAIPLAAIFGWIGASVFTRSNALRAAAAFAWMAGLPLLVSLVFGDLPTVLAYLVLPLIAAGIWRGLGPQSSFTVGGVSDILVTPRPDRVAWLGLAGLATLVAGARFPLLPILVLLAGVAVWLRFRREQSGAHVWALSVAVVPALVLLLPAGVAAGASGSVNFWSWLLGGSGLETAQSQWWVFLAGSQLPLANLVDATNPLVAAMAVVSGWSLLVVALASAIAAAFTKRQAGFLVFPAIAVLAWLLTFTAVGQLTPLVMATAYLLLWTGVLTAMPTVITQAKRAKLRHKTQASSLIVGSTATVLGAAALATTTVVLLLGAPTSGPFAPAPQAASTTPFGLPVTPGQQDDFPLLAVEAQLSPRKARVLELNVQDGVIEAQLLRGQGLMLADRLMTDGFASPANLEAVSLGQQHVADTAGALVTGLRSDAASMVGQLAVDIVLVRDESQDLSTIHNVLDATEGLERIGATPDATMWRVRPDGNRPARAVITDAAPWEIDATDSFTDVDADVVRIDTTLELPQGGTLLLAESFDPHWQARWDGEVVTAQQVGYATAFQLAPGQGQLEVDYRIGYEPWWLGALGASLVVLAISLVPWRARRTTKVLVETVPDVSGGDVEDEGEVNLDE